MFKDLVAVVGACGSVNKFLNRRYQTTYDARRPVEDCEKFHSEFRKKFEDVNINTFPQNVLGGLCKTHNENYFCNDSESSLMSLCRVSSVTTSASIFSTECITVV